MNQRIFDLFSLCCHSEPDSARLDLRRNHFLVGSVQLRTSLRPASRSQHFPSCEFGSGFPFGPSGSAGPGETHRLQFSSS